MKLPFVTTDIQIRFSDLDPLGHVSNSMYMQYFDLGRVAFFSEIYRLDPQCPANVVVNVNLTMKREIRLEDTVHVDTWCSRIGTRSMTVRQVIYANDLLATDGTLILVGFNAETRSSIALPDYWEVTDPALVPVPE